MYEQLFFPRISGHSRRLVCMTNCSSLELVVTAEGWYVGYPKSSGHSRRLVCMTHCLSQELVVTAEGWYV